MEEIWRDIEGFENYKASNLGNIKSLRYNNTNQERILKPKINKQGHLEVTLNKNNKHYYRMVSRLVIEAFTGLKLGKNDIIMYKDNDKTNCSLDNMYLISRGKRQELTYNLDHRDRIKVEYYDEVLPIKEIAKKNDIKPEQIRKRMRDLYWNIYESAEIPLSVYIKKKDRRKIEK